MGIPPFSSGPKSIAQLGGIPAQTPTPRSQLAAVQQYCANNGIAAPLAAWCASEAFSDTSTATLATDGGAVGSLIDITGNGYNMVQATGGQQPLLRKQGLPNGTAALDFANNGTASRMASTTVQGNSLFANAAFTVGFTVYSVASSYYGGTINLLGSPPSPSNSYCAAQYSGNNDIFSQVSGTQAKEQNLSGQSAVQYDPSGVFVYAWDGANLTAGLNGRYASVAAAFTLPSTGAWTMGNLSSGGFPWLGGLSSQWVFPGKHTQAQMDAIGTLLAADSGLVNPALLPIGDSITHGFGLATPYQMNWVTQMAQLLGMNAANTYIPNQGIDGETLETMITDVTNFPNLRTGQASAVRGTKNLITIFGGTNSMGNQSGGGNETGAVAFASLQTLVGLYRAANPNNKIAVATCLPRSAANAGASFESRRRAFNALIRAAGNSLYDILFDFGADSIMGQVATLTNTTYYQADQIHPTQIGHTRLAEIAAGAASQFYSSVPVLASLPGSAVADPTGADATYTTAISSTNYPGSLQSKTAPTILAGITAGRVDWAMTDQRASSKKFRAAFISYENNSAVNQTITFPTAFTNVPTITANDTGLTISASATTLTITAPNNITTFSGNVIVEGF